MRVDEVSSNICQALERGFLRPMHSSPAVLAGAGGGIIITSGSQLRSPMDILRSQGDVGAPFRPSHTGTANVALSSSSVNAFPRPNRAHAPRAQELYQPMRLDSVPSAKPNSLNLGYASLDDDSRYWNSEKKGFRFYRHERITTAADILRKGPAVAGRLDLDTDTSYKAGVARRVADQTPYSQVGPDK